ncbi:unnamed protein product [Chondrus crispus]|uniref:Uncharacterized protein n=1 Tax=Chondrus crispus TaxID=2769 RepID=R7QK61_CHOCR|nr:unnamed protein product [Chondrus crispus]CDF38912.1 unnamed protein product [Chondrus crispus]|eukprot:XP_005718817.1 unnamed protein product [Chondrus crispus]
MHLGGNLGRSRRRSRGKSPRLLEERRKQVKLKMRSARIALSRLCNVSTIEALNWGCVGEKGPIPRILLGLHLDSLDASIIRHGVKRGPLCADKAGHAHLHLEVLCALELAVLDHLGAQLGALSLGLLRRRHHGSQQRRQLLLYPRGLSAEVDGAAGFPAALLRGFLRRSLLGLAAHARKRTQLTHHRTGVGRVGMKARERRGLWRRFRDPGGAVVATRPEVAWI